MSVEVMEQVLRQEEEWAALEASGSTASVDMKNHFPNNVPAGRGCGILAGIVPKFPVDVGAGSLKEVTSTKLHLLGAFDGFGFKGSAEVEIILKGDGKGSMRIKELGDGFMNFIYFVSDGVLYYHVTSGPLNKAKIAQTFSNGSWISGPWVQFSADLKEVVGSKVNYAEVCYWFHKS